MYSQKVELTRNSSHVLVRNHKDLFSSCKYKENAPDIEKTKIKRCFFQTIKLHTL